MKLSLTILVEQWNLLYASTGSSMNYYQKNHGFYRSIRFLSPQIQELQKETLYILPSPTEKLNHLLHLPHCSVFFLLHRVLCMIHTIFPVKFYWIMLPLPDALQKRHLIVYFLSMKNMMIMMHGFYRLFPKVALFRNFWTFSVNLSGIPLILLIVTFALLLLITILICHFIALTGNESVNMVIFHFM